MNQEGRWWHSIDLNYCEIEVSILISALIRIAQPEFVVESGSYEGQTTEIIGRALVDNGHGTLEALEINEDISKRAQQRCADLPTVRVININSFNYIPPKPIDFLYIDGDYNRDGDVKHFLPYMSGRSIIVVHDMVAPVNIPQREKIIEMCGDEHILFDNPRGLLVVKLPAVNKYAELSQKERGKRMGDGTFSDYVASTHCYMQKNEHNALKEIIDSLPSNSVCVNIGAGLGVSGSAFIESYNVRKLYTIDLYATTSESTLGNLEYEMNIFTQFGFNDSSRYQQIQGDSAEIGNNWQHEDIDMVFIDGDHSYEHCKMDINAWLPQIKQGGIMSFHDYKEPQWPGIEKAVDELLYEHQMIANEGTFAAFKISRDIIKMV